MRTILAAVVAALALSLHVFVPQQASALPTTVSGGIQRTDATFTKAGSPYLIEKTLEIPAGVNLTVEAGVEIRSSASQPLFWAQGSIRLNGTATEPIKIFAPAIQSIIKVADASELSSVVLNHVHIQGAGQLLEGYPMSKVSIKNSEIFNTTGGLDLSPSNNSMEFENNVFSNSGTFRIYYDGYLPGQITFKNNLFLGNSEAKNLFEISNSWGSNLSITQNTFRGAGPVISVNRAQDSQLPPFSMNSNYWDTTSLLKIAERTLDETDSIAYKGSIDVSGYLAQAPAGAPATSILQALFKKYEPTNLTLEKITSSTAEFKWVAPIAKYGPDEVGFVIEASKTANFDYVEFASNVYQGKVLGKLEYLTPDKGYFVRVSAYSGENYFAYSSILTIKTAKQGPPAAPSLKIQGLSPTLLTYSILPSDDTGGVAQEEVSYKAFVSKDLGATWVLNSTHSFVDGLEAQVRNVQPKSNLWLKAVAVSSFGESLASDVIKSVGLAIPAPDLSVFMAAKTGAILNLTTAEMAFIDQPFSYKIFVSTNGKTFTLKGTCAGQQLINLTNYTVTKLKAKTKYWVKAVLSTPAGDSIASKVVTFTTSK